MDTNQLRAVEAKMAQGKWRIANPKPAFNRIETVIAGEVECILLDAGEDDDAAGIVYLKNNALAFAEEIDRLRESLFKAVAMIGHAMPMDTAALVAGENLVARDVWQEANALLFPAAKG